MVCAEGDYNLKIGNNPAEPSSRPLNGARGQAWEASPQRMLGSQVARSRAAPKGRGRKIACHPGRKRSAIIRAVRPLTS